MIDVASAYRQHGPMVLRRCRRLLGDEHRAVDAMHDVFEQLWRRRGRLEDRGLSSLLYTMATNRCLNLRRRWALRPEDGSALLDRGDRLQLALDAGTAPHAVLFSVDGRGHATVHFPRDGADTRVPRDDGGAWRLPHAFVLDDAPAWEAFYAVTAPEPIDVDALVEGARELARQPHALPPRLDLPAGWGQARVALRKEPHR